MIFKQKKKKKRPILGPETRMKIISDLHSPKGESLWRPTLRRTFGLGSREDSRELIPGPSQIETWSCFHVHQLSSKLTDLASKGSAWWSFLSSAMIFSILLANSSMRSAGGGALWLSAMLWLAEMRGRGRRDLTGTDSSCWVFIIQEALGVHPLIIMIIN